MNTKNNKRRRESVEKIEKVFVELLQTQELNEITVSDICKRAGINRSTFYANYVDLQELADKIVERLEEDVNFLYREEIEEGFNSNDYLRLFRHIRDNQLFYKTYFKLGYDRHQTIKRYEISHAAEHFDNRFIAYHMAFFKSGFNAIVKIWLAGGCVETPEEMDETIRTEYRGRISPRP